MVISPISSLTDHTSKNLTRCFIFIHLVWSKERDGETEQRQRDRDRDRGETQRHRDRDSGKQDGVTFFLVLLVKSRGKAKENLERREENEKERE